MKYNFSMFADDTKKLGGIMTTEEDVKMLQGDMDKLGKWARTWHV